MPCKTGPHDAASVDHELPGQRLLGGTDLVVVLTGAEATERSEFSTADRRLQTIALEAERHGLAAVHLARHLVIEGDDEADRAIAEPGDRLENYTAGRPFPMDAIQCRADPQAGTKIIWDFDDRWEGDGSNAGFLYTYWDRGEQLPLHFEGRSEIIQRSHRVERKSLDQGATPRESASMTYRYKASNGPRADAKNDGARWVPAIGWEGKELVGPARFELATS